jgi:branched-chain amino acid transport system substrate-binding protein
VLYQNDDYGKDLLAGLRNGLGAKKKLIVSTQGYNVDDPDVQSQIAKLKSARASALALFATPKFAIQAYRYAFQLGWKPKVYINTVSSASNTMAFAVLASSKKQTEGTISIVFIKDPTDPRWAKDRGIKLYRSIMKKFKGTNPKDVYNVYGMSVAHTFVEALKKAGKNPTRDSIMRAARHLTIRNDPFLLPGVVVRTTPSDGFPLDQARLERFHNGRWLSFGGLFRVR